MKTKFTLVIILTLFSASYLFAQGKTVKTNIKVLGNCGMCKQRIETALDKPGIKFAAWDSKTKNLELVYNARKISEKEIHEIVAAAGHDTEQVKAKDDTYGKLPFCCLYRDHDHSGMKDSKPHDHK
jgi:periplasmic mercuric ion binding protein